MSLLEKQSAVSQQFPMPVDVTDEATSVNSIAGETVQLVVASTNVNDAGSAAGTVVYARLAFGGVLDSMGNRIGSKNDTGFAFVTGTILTTEIDLDWTKYETFFNQGDTRANKLANLAKDWSNGRYAVDYARGIIIGKKATAGTSDTANYKYRAGIVSVVVSPSGSSTIQDVDGVQAHDAVLNTTTNKPVMTGGRAADPTSLPTAVSAGDASYIGTSLQQEVLVYLTRLLSGENQSEGLLSVSQKPTATSTNSYTRFNDNGATTGSNVKASPGNVFSAVITNSNAAVRHFQLFNLTVAPTNGVSVPFYSAPIPAANGGLVLGSDFFGTAGANFVTGISWGFSITKSVFTAGAAADQNVFIHYK